VLIDTGEIIYEHFKKENCNMFVMPPELASIPFFNQMCRIDKFPDLGKNRSVSDFIEAVIDKYLLKFTVKEKKFYDCKEMEWERECFTVDVEFANEKIIAKLCAELNTIQLTADNLRRLEEELAPPTFLTYGNTPMITDVEKKYFIPKKDDNVLLYPVHYIKSNYIFGQIRMIDDDWEMDEEQHFPRDVSTAFDLKASMNDRRLRYQKLTTTPVVNQLVVAARFEVILKFLKF
jgi:hypothetical protein